MTQERSNKTTNAVDILNDVLGKDPERRARIEQVKQDMAIGLQIYEARKAAGLTQAELAERVGTTQSIISDLEDAEYQGHSMSMLRRVAAALGLEVRVQFVKTAA